MASARRRTLWGIGLCCAVAVGVMAAEPVLAWQFSMKTKYVNQFKFVKRYGPADLFGLDTNGSSVGVAGPRTTNRGRLSGFVGSSPRDRGLPKQCRQPLIPQLSAPGNTSFCVFRPTPVAQNTMNSAQVQDLNGNPMGLRITQGGFSAVERNSFVVNEQKLTFYPEFQLNESVVVNTAINVGGARNKFFNGAAAGMDGIGVPPFEEFMTSGDAQSGSDTVAMPSWQGLSGAVHTPWGTLLIGHKGWPFGLDATFGDNVACDAYAIAAPYGPFNIVFSLWLNQKEEEGAQNTGDSGSMNRYAPGVWVTYEAGTVHTGVGFLARRSVFGPKTASPQFNYQEEDQQAPEDRNLRIGNRDSVNLSWCLFFKWFNGSTFFNAEYAWMTVDKYPIFNGAQLQGLAVLDPMADPPFPNNFIITDIHQEAYHVFLETGFLLGPTKFSFMWAQSSGPVLNNNNGYLRAVTDRADPKCTPERKRNPKVYCSYPVNWKALAPYEYLMFRTYAGGNQGGYRITDLGLVKDKEGMLTDGYALGFRIDHLIAANLHLWGSFIWANRLEKFGTFFGQYASSGGDALSGEPGSTPPWTQPNPDLPTPPSTRRGFSNNAGYDPLAPLGYAADTNIGWEVNLGMKWVLLENLNFSVRWSYWQPGKWFNTAYQGIVNGADMQPIGDRSPIMAFQWSFEADL